MTDVERADDLPETQAAVGSDADLAAAQAASGEAGAPEASGAAETTRTPAAEAQTNAGAAAAGEADAATARFAPLEARVAELEAQVAREREAATDYMQRLQRAQADFSNYKRRAQQEEQQREALAAWRAMAGVLPALDSLERAFATLPPSLRTYSWIDGVALVHMQMERALAALGLAAVEAAPGAAFDPSRHEAIGEVETAEHPAGAIAVVVQRGYAAGNVLLRPALVQVARAPQATTPTPSETTTPSAAEERPAAAAVPGEEGSDTTTSTPSSEAPASGA